MGIFGKFRNLKGTVRQKLKGITSIDIAQLRWSVFFILKRHHLVFWHNKLAIIPKTPIGGGFYRHRAHWWGLLYSIQSQHQLVGVTTVIAPIGGGYIVITPIGVRGGYLQPQRKLVGATYSHSANWWGLHTIIEPFGGGLLQSQRHSGKGQKSHTIRYIRVKYKQGEAS